jgi:pectate lyase
MQRLGRFALAFAVAAGVSQPEDAAALPAFPGAEGFGAVASGGRGGQVLKVTTLAASGAGSLQAALDTAGPRIIVFEVSGVIEGDVHIPHGDVTIAGQTAPGGGITIAGRLLGEYDGAVGNIILRFLRIRPVYDGSPGEQFDAAQLSRNAPIILDHVSVSWGVDETLDLYEATDVTVQWCTIEASSTSGHPEGMHNYGLINGPDGRRISVHHNLFVHHQNRNPAIANGPAEVINNVVYDVRHGFVHHNPASGPFNIVGNVYIQGPEDDLIPFYFDDENGFSAPDLSYYLADNYIDDPGDFVGVVDDPWQSPPAHPTFSELLAPVSLRAPSAHVFSGNGYVPVTRQPSSEVVTLVRERAGAFPRDVVTRGLIGDLDNRGGGWGAVVPADLMDGLTPTAPPTDADDDGIADDWESSHGLDPSDAGDHSAVMDSGYTAIEEYANSLADALAGAPPTGPSGSSSAATSGAGGSSAQEDDSRSRTKESCAFQPPPSSSLGAYAALALLFGLGLRRRQR